MTANRVFHVDDWTPLYLSCLAGASTCIGAAVVFLHPRDEHNKRHVSPNTMCFSLALAGSVMITVSVVSIGPECLQDPHSHGGGGGDVSDYSRNDESDAVNLLNMTMMPIWSSFFLQRLVFFAVGCLLYFGLSVFAFPEADEVLGLQEKQKDVPVMVEESGSIGSADGDSPQKGKAANIRSRKQQQQQFVKDLENTQFIPTEDEPPRDSTGSVLESVPLNGGDRHGRMDIATTSATKTGSIGIVERKQSNSWTRWARGNDLNKDEKRAWRVAMLLFVSLLCHNFPEGLAVAASALESKKLGITVTIGIMIHNIPEGIAIAIPCLAARPDSPMLGFALASLSGLAEPLGAFVAVLCLSKASKQHDASTVTDGGDSIDMFSMENVLSFVAGIMITVALYELFPEAKRHSTEGHKALIFGTVTGVIVMVATELYTP